MDYAAVSQAVKRFEGLMEKDKTARKIKDEIESELG